VIEVGLPGLCLDARPSSKNGARTRMLRVG
jgi:hypothetical protein